MTKKNLILLLLLFIIAAVGIAFSASEAPDDPTKKGYIGAETCKGCHETQFETYSKSIHSKKAVKGPEYKEACETCHGAGAKHVEKGGGRGVDIFDFGKKVDPKSRAAKCLSCHDETPHLANWNLSRHSAADVVCNDCHSVHSQGIKNLKMKEPELCYTCHLSIRSQANRQSHHPIKEGKITCSACHDPHGEFGSKMIKADSINELCYKCHAEKRGPYMWEHPPVEENCLNCHVPHGSNHNKLLVRKPPQLCQSCHALSGHPATPYTSFETIQGAATASKNRMMIRGCVNCHSNVHGSNSIQGTRGQRDIR
ncbi:MAG TPA: DmsE family decaheme c-type cytochrome [Dissulfurispiraceae bacterium]|nr:DmsE family decaheme c-type cytochrome [Dissulfurispiraceae bacterium]